MSALPPTDDSHDKSSAPQRGRSIKAHLRTILLKLLQMRNKLSDWYKSHFTNPEGEKESPWKQIISWPVVAAILAVVVGFGVGVLSMTPPEFIIAKVCFIFSGIALFAKVTHWLSNAKTNRGERMLLTFLISGVVGVGVIEAFRWVSLRQASLPGSSLSLRQDAPTPSPSTTSPPGDLFLFKDDPLFTEGRKLRITKDLENFRAFLLKLGFNLPSHKLPIGIGGHSAGFGIGHVGINTDFISLEGAKIDDEVEATQSYAEYVIIKAEGGPFDMPKPLTSEYLARENVAFELATYFNWSFWGTKKGNAKNWLAAFWEMRDRFGAEFTDLLLTYTVKSLAEGPSPFARHTFEAGKPISLPNKFVDYVIYSHLEQAEKVVDNLDAKLPAIQEILNEHGLAIPK